MFFFSFFFWQAFVARWEREVLQGREREVELFRASEALLKWNRGWKTEVYFTLRAQELIRQVEAALAQPVLAQPGPGPFVLKATEAVAEQLLKVWAPDIFLPGLEASFLRLGFQMASRVRTWVLAGLPEGAALAAEAGGSWSEAPLPMWAAAHADFNALARLLRREWSEAAARALGSSALPAPVAAAVEVAARELETEAAGAVGAHVTRALGTECAASLQFVRKITSLFFRADASGAAAGGGLPETAMAEVESVMSPLRRLWGACAWGVPAAQRQQWTEAVAASVLSAYRELAQEVLVQAAATQKFIQQRNKGEGANGMAKIVAQFRLDIARLAAILRDEHGVTFPEQVQLLQDTVSRYL